MICLNVIAIIFYLLLLRTPEFIAQYNFLSLFYNISIAFTASSIFYLINVFIPGQKRKSILKSNLEGQYLNFKKECIYLFLSALGYSSSEELQEKLCILEKFKKYFKEKYCDYPDRWYAVWGNMDDYLLEDLLIQLGILKDDIQFVLNNTEVYDKKVLSFFKDLSQYAYGFHARGAHLEYERKKSLAGFLWSLFSGWTFSEGHKKEDIVKRMIKII